MLGFGLGMRSMAWPWWLWVGLLVLLNGVAPLFALDRIESVATLAVFMLGALALLTIHWFKGFVRLMGLGHAGWFALIPWLGWRLDAHDAHGLFATWLVAVMVVNALSLVIDVADVVRYLRGDRTPSVTYGSALEVRAAATSE